VTLSDRVRADDNLPEPIVDQDPETTWSAQSDDSCREHARLMLARAVRAADDAADALSTIADRMPDCDAWAERAGEIRAAREILRTIRRKCA
jgi:hypothetical protein